ncbi:MAG TPA: chromosome segregation protein SMC [Syntrophorhabdaceae bacterium]|nr:chromosome segregation protein SMC [Syntrophorhabdaceae bacterium]
MKLARLEIFGFKSFLNRTVFQFSEGVTSIVGPNGCGKSNIVDAIVWVLGERGTKSLRVKDMGDVIFHGSNGRRPVNIAEVSLDLTDGDKDLVVKRRIYRDGTNEYFLNGNLVRLKDVQDAFLGTGIGLNSYAIIEQGRIESFIQMKPLERRIIVEEVSGITRFEEKKRDAISRMEEVTANLERIEDIYREVGAGFEKAEHEWQRWKAYQVLADKLHEIDKLTLIDGYAKLAKRIVKILERQKDLELEIVKKEEDKARIKTDLEAKESEFALTDNVQRQLEVDIKGKEKDMESRLIEIEYVKEERQRLETQSATYREEEARTNAQIQEAGQEVETLSQTSLAQKGRLDEEESAESSLREQTEKLKSTIEGYEKRLEEDRTALFVSMSKLTDTKNRLAQIERIEIERRKREEKEAIEKRELGEVMERLEAKLTTLRENLERENQALHAAGEMAAGAFEERETARRRIEEERAGVENLKNERKIKEDFFRELGGFMESSESGEQDATKLINMIKVEEAKEKALERFFSHELEYQVLADKESGVISTIVQKQEGNYIFFPRKGIFRLGGSEVEVDIKWVPTIDEALSRIEGGEEGIFMNDTVCIDSRGFILSGKDAKKIDLKQFREKLKLEKELKTIALTLKTRQDAIASMQESFAASEKEYEKIKRDREGKEDTARKTEKEILIVEAQLKTTLERLNGIEARIDLTDDRSSDEAQQLSEEKKRAETEKADIESRMAALKADLEIIRKDYEAIRSKWHEITISIERQKSALKSLDEDKERKLSAIRSLAGEIETGRGKLKQAQAEISRRSDKIQALEKDYDDLKIENEKHLARFEELKKMLGNLHMEKQALQDAIDVLGKETEKIRVRRENTDKDMAVLAEKQETILERLKTTYNIENPSDVTVELRPNIEEEREAVVAEIADMGEINFRAEKEYLELKERLLFLEKQKEDLQNAMESLKKTITKIDHLTKELFTETFDKVNDAFKRFTDLLFKGGKGHLLVNQENGGIEMFAQPPGKKVLRMELLSGGEKALISLAFLLALMDTKPTPFALMDEIDAPLDDANLMGLLEIIKGMGLKTQVIFITHNRITMECSDTIYGITMEEVGVSKTVSVKL